VQFESKESLLKYPSSQFLKQESNIKNNKKKIIPCHRKASYLQREEEYTSGDALDPESNKLV
jgi:hypothetical protein